MRVVHANENCQLVTIWVGGKGHDSELPASYHRGKTMIDIGQAEKKRLKGSGENVNDSTPQVINSSYLIDSDILSQCCMGSDALVCLGTCALE